MFGILFCYHLNFEKVRKTAKNEENLRKSRGYRSASFKTGTLEYRLIKRFFRFCRNITDFYNITSDLSPHKYPDMKNENYSREYFCSNRKNQELLDF